MVRKDFGFLLNRASKELKPHGTTEFPCAVYASRHTEKSKNVIPWHWHEEMEIIYIASGTLRAKVPSRTFILEQGDCIVINSNVLHFAAAEGECSLHSLVFAPSLVGGTEESVFTRNYIRPLLSCPSFSGFCFPASKDERAADWFCEAFTSMTQNVPGFEFTVRENLSRFCYSLYEKFQPQLGRWNPALNQDSLRVKKMLAYMHENFSDNITLADIARSADISERECLRCFQRTIQLSPMQYLLKYRIMQGAELLISRPADGVAEIAGFCGFDSPSYFTKMFGRFYGCTPRAYRKLNAEG